MKPNHNRREFLQIATAGAAAAFVAGVASGAESNRKGKARNRRSEKASAPASTTGRKLPFELGLASYTCRKFDLTQTLAMAKRVGLTHIALKDVHLSLKSSPEQIQAAIAQVKEAGIDLYGGGVDLHVERSPGQPGLRLCQGRRDEGHHRCTGARPAAPGGQESQGIRHQGRHS